MLPDYTPDFVIRRTYRMSLLKIFEGSRGFCGGLAIVWCDYVWGDLVDNARKKQAFKDLPHRRPAVMKLPDIWMTQIPPLWALYPSETYDQTWEFLDPNQPKSLEDNVRAWGGTWLPVRGNLLMQMMGSFNSETRLLGLETRQRALGLLHGYDVVAPNWLLEKKE